MKKILAFALFISFIFLGFLFPNFSSNLSNNILKVPWYFKNKTSNIFYYITDFFKFKNSLIREKDSLEDEVNKLRLTKADYELLLKENDELKEEFGRVIKRDRVFSNILSKPPQSPYDTFVVDVGLFQDIRVGNKAYLSDRILLGVVSEVNNSSSIIKMYSSSGEKIEGTNSRTGTNYLIEGIGGANFRVTVPKDADIVWGDNIILPQSTPSLLGTVNYIDSNSQSSFKDIYIVIPSNVYNAKYVFIEK